MNDNVGDMPIEIFGDYISDTLGIHSVLLLKNSSLSDYFEKFLSRSLTNRPSSPTLKGKPVVSLAPLGRLTGLHLRCRGFRAAKTGEVKLGCG